MVVAGLARFQEKYSIARSIPFVIFGRIGYNSRGSPNIWYEKQVLWKQMLLLIAASAAHPAITALLIFTFQRIWIVLGRAVFFKIRLHVFMIF